MQKSSKMQIMDQATFPHSPLHSLKIIYMTIQALHFHILHFAFCIRQIRWWRDGARVVARRDATHSPTFHIFHIFYSKMIFDIFEKYSKFVSVCVSVAVLWSGNVTDRFSLAGIAFHCDAHSPKVVSTWIGWGIWSVLGNSTIDAPFKTGSNGI